MEEIETDVLIAGGGPCGLMLANELGRRGIRTLLVDMKPGTAFNPQANATQARTMEHFRRLGFAHEVRAQGLPGDHPTDIAYFTRYTGWELARLSLPTADEAVRNVRGMGGSWSAAELPHRVSQKFVEAILRRHAEGYGSNEIRYGWRLLEFEDSGEEIGAVVCPHPSPPPEGEGASVRVRAKYLVGADGARSFVRNTLGIAWGGATGVKRDFMGGQMFAVYLRAPQFYRVFPHARAWMYVTVNAQRRAFMASVDGQSEFAFHAAIHEGEDAERWTGADARRVFAQALGREIPIEVLSFGTWTAGHSLVAQSFHRGRVFSAGDAAHLFTPTGGLGYNTAVEDAVNLAWKLASAVRGCKPPALLDSYEIERKPLAVRNTGYAKGFADSLGNYSPAPEIEDDTPAGDAARRRAGEYFARHGRSEFNIPGITFGGRYDASPVIVSDGTQPPADTPNVYVPTACPGGRPPHLWLADGRSLYDAFGFEWTLLRLSRNPGSRLVEAARRRGLQLEVFDLASVEARDLYAADLSLIRPDQIVAWRGNDDSAADTVIATVTGHG